jgi:molybdate transport system substrate-binding protein
MQQAIRILAILLLAAGSSPSMAAAPGLSVFAASSLTNVLQEIGDSYTAESKIAVKLSFGASSVLAKQVEAGAPVDVFVSADEDWMNYLQTRNLLASGTRADIVSNDLVLVAPADSTQQMMIAPGFGLAAALGESGRLAMGEPASVPAGKYAQAALVKLGVWPSVEKRIVSADNVRTALNFVARGEAPLGIVYATDARVEPGVRVVGIFPAATHEPITYPAAAIARSGANAAAFVRYLSGAKAQEIFRKAGFRVP